MITTSHRLFWALAAAAFLRAPMVNASAPVPQAVIDAPPNSWVKLNVNRFVDAWAPGGLTPYHTKAVIEAWSSFAWDSNRGNIILWGGGHANYHGNEVYLWNSETGLWSRGSLSSSVVADPNVHARFETIDGPMHSPISMHTYDGNMFLPRLDRFVVFGGPQYNQGGYGADRYDDNGTRRWTGPYLWDPSKADPWKTGGLDGSHIVSAEYPANAIQGGGMWQNRDSWPQGIPAGSDRIFATNFAAYADENGQDVLYLAGTGGLWRYTIRSLDDPSQDTYELVGRFNGGLHPHGAGTFNPERRLWVELRGSDFVYYDLSSPGVALGKVFNSRIVYADASEEGTFAFGSWTWPTLGDRFGLEYDPPRDRFLLWEGTNELWELKAPDDLATGHWILKRLTPPITNNPYPDRIADSVLSGGGYYTWTGTAGKWKYIAEWDVFIGLYHPIRGDIWVYKPALSDHALPTGEVGRPYRAQLQAQGGVPPYNWQISQGRLPEGLILDGLSGEIRGMPTIADTQSFTVDVVDAAQGRVSLELTITTTANDIVFADDFQDGTLSPWTRLRNGQVTLIEDGDGNRALRKTTNNDPHGGWAELSLPVGNYEMVLHARKASDAGGGTLRYSVTDALGNGYGIYLSSGNGRIIIERRDGWKTTELARSSSGIAGGTGIGRWYTLRLTRQGGMLRADLFLDRPDVDASAPHVTVFAHDATHLLASRVSVNGGYDYDTDNLRIKQLPSPPPNAPLLFDDDFERGSLGPWKNLRKGEVAVVYDQSVGWVLRKSTLNDPNGGMASLAMPAQDFDLILHTRKVDTTGGSALRYSLTDANGNGYGISLGYPSGRLILERRDAWVTTELARSASGIAGMTLGSWYTLRLTRQGDHLRARVYAGRTDDLTATPLHDVQFTDGTHGSLTQINVNGGYTFDTDNLRIW